LFTNDEKKAGNRLDRLGIFPEREKQDVFLAGSRDGFTPVREKYPTGPDWDHVNAYRA
jgi:hypothetical protein